MPRNHKGVYIAAIGGSFFAIIADLFSNAQAATTLKLGEVIVVHLLQIRDAINYGIIGLFIVILATLFVVWWRKPKDEEAAVAYGLAIFTFLNIASPFAKVGQETSENQGIQYTSNALGTELTFIPAALAADNTLNCVPGRLDAPNMILTQDKVVSACKPRYSGVFGLGSFFNNKVTYCVSDHKLIKGARVEVVQSWETTMRGYRYSEIKYNHDGQVCTGGWVSDGRGDVHHLIDVS